MKKRLLKITMILAALAAFAGCQREDIVPVVPDNNSDIGVFGDYIKMKLNVVAPDPIKVGTKAVDPDGKGVQTMTLFCFDEYGLFISTATASIEQNLNDIEAGGIFDAFIPNTTRIMHLVGNQNMTPFKEEDFRQKSEDEVMSILEGSAGMIIYWARVEVPKDVNTLYTDDAGSLNRSMSQAILDWITIETNPALESHTVGTGSSAKTYTGKDKPILLLRNQARVTVVSDGAQTEAIDDKEWNGTYFKVTGFTVCNTQAFGTVAPYHSSYGFPTYKSSTYDPDYDVVPNSNTDNSNLHWVKESYITLPENKDKLSDIMDVDIAFESFVFESENSSADPVDVINRGSNIVNGTAQQEMYYKVSLTNDDGEQVLLRRNHHYEINIAGRLNYGVATFAQALEAPATNNVWLSISDEVKSVQNNEFKLTVDQTSVVLNADDVVANNTLNLSFEVEAVAASAVIDAADLSITWVEDNQRVSSTLNPDLTVGNAVAFATDGQGTITLKLNQLNADTDKLEGTLLVKYGHLQRKIKIVTINTQKFVPAWVSTEVYGAVTGDKESRENVTLVFTIPESCPAELFPLDVLVSVNDLDIRSDAGQTLPVVRRGEDGYGATDLNGDGVDDDYGYKYKYTINSTGTQRLYLENIITSTSSESKTITLEAENFETLQKVVTFSSEQYRLEVRNMQSYDYTPSGAASPAESINYILVPQKRYARVVFDLATLNGTQNISVSPTDEFLLYSSNLDHYRDDDSRLSDDYKSNFDCSFKPYSESQWGTGGRIFGFYPRTTISGGEFEIYMETNKAKSSEVVRIASNQSGSTSVLDPAQNYAGQTFRSVTFEMANFHPFRFAAQINDSGEYVSDGLTSEESISDIELTYLPNQKVAVSFDVTSFKGNDVNGTSVDPFGTGFEIYIDAPMLTLANGDNPAIEGEMVAMFEKNADGTMPSTVASKAKLEDLGNGKFVYRVDPDRDTERGFWNGSAVKIADATNPNQAGERKTIIFKTKEIVSTGNITISSNPDQVVYYSKTFRVSNTPVSGSIKYGTDNVPAGQFISFTRAFNGSRIGSVNVTEDGKYELKLRKEYEFYWTNDPIKLTTSIGGKYYSATYDSLEDLYNNPNIVFTEEVETE